MTIIVFPPYSVEDSKQRFREAGYSHFVAIQLCIEKPSWKRSLEFRKWLGENSSRGAWATDHDSAFDICVVAFVDANMAFEFKMLFG